MFKFWGSQDQQPPAQPSTASSQYWYSPSGVSSPSSSRPGTPSASISSDYGMQRPTSSHVSPAGAADVIASLKGKSVEELRKLLSDKDAYNRFLLSLDQVKVQNDVRDELRKQVLQLANDNLEKEPRIMELRNQCRIIRTTEVAAARENLGELERRKDDILKSYSAASLLNKLQGCMNKAEEESESVHQQLLMGEMDAAAFVQKYKKVRNSYHRKALTLLAAKTSPAL